MRHLACCGAGVRIRSIRSPAASTTICRSPPCESFLLAPPATSDPRFSTPSCVRAIVSPRSSGTRTRRSEASSRSRHRRGRRRSLQPRVVHRGRRAVRRAGAHGVRVVGARRVGRSCRGGGLDGRGRARYGRGPPRGRRSTPRRPACSATWTGPPAEDAAPQPPAGLSWRPAHETAVLESARRSGARAVVVRPGIVYGGAQGAVAELLQAAANGLIRVIGDGSNRWPSIYDRDLAELYVRLATNPDAEGVFHATDEADERVNDIVEAIARHARTRPDVRHVPLLRGAPEAGPVRRRRGPRSGGAQPAGARARLVAVAPLDHRQRRPAVRRVPQRAGGRVGQRAVFRPPCAGRSKDRPLHRLGRET